MHFTPFDIIPNELISLIGESIPDARSLNCVLKCSRHLAAVFTPLLYRMAVEDHDGLPAIHWAAREGHEPLAEFLISNKGIDIDLENVSEDGDTIARTPLDYAVEAGQVSMVRFLLQNGATVNIPNAGSKRVAPIYTATEMGLSMEGAKGKTQPYGILDDVRTTKGLAVAKILLNHGADPNFTLSGTNGESLLHRSAAYGGTAMVKLLLENRAEVDLKDRFGKTALHRAITESKGDGFNAQMCAIDIVELLGWWGADMFAVDSGSKTAMEYALEKGMDCVVESLRGNWLNCYRFTHLCFGEGF